MDRLLTKQVSDCKCEALRECILAIQPKSLLLKHLGNHDILLSNLPGI